MNSALWTGLLVALLFIVWRVLRASARNARATPMRFDDPWLMAAMARARESYGEMLALVGRGEEVAVKFPLTNAEGEVEHVWGGVAAADEDGVEVSIMTPLLVGDTPEGPRHIKRDEIEDWQCFLADGGIRGGFTTQAQLAVCKREGFAIPQALIDQELRFLDPIEFSSAETSS